ncbi:hypothetical protein [Okeania sp. SIO3I5]|nr:hypothetical protein [Okeania sp. SIO3I5]
MSNQGFHYGNIRQIAFSNVKYLKLSKSLSKKTRRSKRYEKL